MDVYGLTTPEVFRIDDLLDFSNDDLISSTDSTLLNHHHHQQQHFSPPENPYNYHRSSFSASAAPTHSTDFTDDLCVPSDDVAELEWLSQFVDDSFSDFPANELTGTVAFRSDTSFTGRARSKRSRAASTTRKWCSSPQSEATTMIGKSKTTATAAVKLEMTSSSSEINNNRDWSSSPVAGEVRRCTHCASEKTPQWRTGPLGPKTLCNACGVRYKSGRLVPEYRPAASPTFVLTQHSNSHRKVMELRRQKEMMHQDEQQQQQQQRQFYRHHHHHHHDFEVC